MASHETPAGKEADAPTVSRPEKRDSPNAFSALMAKKPRESLDPKHPKSKAKQSNAKQSKEKKPRGLYLSRDALGMYIDNPAAFVGTSRAGQVIYYNDAFVAIHDKFPKASVHCLLLPRDPAVALQQPVALLSRRNDAAATALLAALRTEAERLRDIVAGELERRFGQYSAADAARQAVLRGEGEESEGDDQEVLPPGRDWKKDVVVGVHARPSMNHLHVHVLSRDMHSDKVRHRKHYNSFTTPFLVRLDEFPLAPDDPRLPRAAGPSTAPADDADAGDAGDDDGGDGGDGDEEDGHRLTYLQSDLRCWRCKKNFGNKFQELKRHLDVEFEAWKKE